MSVIETIASVDLPNEPRVNPEEFARLNWSALLPGAKFLLQQVICGRYPSPNIILGLSRLEVAATDGIRCYAAPFIGRVAGTHTPQSEAEHVKIEIENNGADTSPQVISVPVGAFPVTVDGTDFRASLFNFHEPLPNQSN